jgi:hypothetical protein
LGETPVVLLDSPTVPPALHGDVIAFSGAFLRDVLPIVR